jgi:MFS family permease
MNGGSSDGRNSLYGLVAAYLVSETGTAMSAVAIPWLVLVTTGSPAATGIVGFAQMAPYVTLQAVAGPVVDRVGLRRTFLIGNSIAAVIMCAIPALHAAGRLDLGALAGLVAVAGAVRGVADCAVSPLVPITADLGGFAYERATGIYSGANRTALLVGMPTAGALIAAIGASGVVLIDGVTFAAGVLILATFVPASVGRVQRPASAITLRSYAADLAEGLRFLRADRLLLALALSAAATNLLDQALISVLLPVWAHDRVHRAIAIGLVGGVLGIGLLGGVMAGAWFGHRLPRRMIYAVGQFVAASPPFFALAAWSSLAPVLPLVLVCGVAGGVLNPISGAAMYERIPAQLQARVLGAVKASAWVGIPFGSLFGGLLAETTGLTAALVTSGSLMLLVTLAPFVFPSWRGLDRQPAPATTAPATTAPATTAPAATAPATTAPATTAAATTAAAPARSAQAEP